MFHIKLAMFPFVFLTRILLWCLDICINLMLKGRKNERAIKPTKRKPFSAQLKRELMHAQKSKCMYCGHIKTSNQTDIDHIYPVVRGGSNERSNLQILCKPCNQRKGMQTDEEFRVRYGSVMPKKGKSFDPPNKPIPQQKFRDITKTTEMASSTRKFKNSRYISGRQKIISGSFSFGFVLAVISFISISLWFPDISFKQNMLYYIPIATWLGVWIAFIARSKYSGQLEL